MESQRASSAVNTNAVNGEESMADGVLYVKVMTDEQMDVLRHQISVYASICEQLVEMHKAVNAQNDSIAGLRLGNLYCDSLMTSGGHKIAARQRWTPTPVQLQILESVFDQGHGTPSKQKIKEITHELTQHRQISETNVYNWFQNRRARSKRKQKGSSLPNNAESEAEAEIESPSENKANAQKISSNDNTPPRVDPSYHHNTEQLSSDMQHYTGQGPKRTQGMMSPSSSRSSGILGQMSFYENILSNPRIDHLRGKMELAGSYSPLHSGDSYDLMG